MRLTCVAHVITKNNCLFQYQSFEQPKLYLDLFIKDRQSKMGSIQACTSHNQNALLEQYLTMQETGSIIKLRGREKETFVRKQLNKTFQENEIHRLQPAAANQHTGFLYKVGVFFYEGHLSGYSTMEEKGKLVLFHRNIQFQGKFKDNQPHGQGTLRKTNEDINISGLWQAGFPKRLSFNSQGLNYRIEIDPKENQPLNFPNSLKASLTYPNQRRYTGILQYNQNRSYEVTGQGVMEYPNGDTLQGEFTEGYLNHRGIYRSSRGTYDGQFKRGKFNGRGQFQYPDGNKLMIEWRDNKPQGKGIMKLKQRSAESNFQVMDVTYSDGKRIMLKQSGLNV